MRASRPSAARPTAPSDSPNDASVTLSNASCVTVSSKVCVRVASISYGRTGIPGRLCFCVHTRLFLSFASRPRGAAAPAGAARRWQAYSLGRVYFSVPRAARFLCGMAPTVAVSCELGKAALWHTQGYIHSAPSQVERFRFFEPGSTPIIQDIQAASLRPRTGGSTISSPRTFRRVELAALRVARERL